MYIGRIITKSKNIETIDFVDITQNFNKEDNSIPTLIIGKKNAEEIYGKENIHVLDKKITDNVYWTFGKLERRNEHESDLSSFNKLLVKKLVNDIQYEYIDIFNAKYSSIKKLLHNITNSENYFYITESHIYGLIGNIVYGISFNELEYVDIQREKILGLIKKNLKNKIITNNYFISKNLRKHIGDNKIVIPYLYFLAKK